MHSKLSEWSSAPFTARVLCWTITTAHSVLSNRKPLYITGNTKIQQVRSVYHWSILHHHRQSINHPSNSSTCPKMQCHYASCHYINSTNIHITQLRATQKTPTTCKNVFDIILLSEAIQCTWITRREHRFVKWKVKPVKGKACCSVILLKKYWGTQSSERIPNFILIRTMQDVGKCIFHRKCRKKSIFQINKCLLAWVIVNCLSQLSSGDGAVAVNKKL